MYKLIHLTRMSSYGSGELSVCILFLSAHRNEEAYVMYVNVSFSYLIAQMFRVLNNMWMQIQYVESRNMV